MTDGCSNAIDEAKSRLCDWESNLVSPDIVHNSNFDTLERRRYFTQLSILVIDTAVDELRHQDVLKEGRCRRIDVDIHALHSRTDQ